MTAFSLPWHKEAGRHIGDLSAQELAGIATGVLQSTGRSMLAARVVYRAIEVNPYQVEAIARLSDLFRGRTIGARPEGDEALAGLVLEFGLDPESRMNKDQLVYLAAQRFDIQVLWGFAKPYADIKVNLMPGSPKDPLKFEVQELDYLSFIMELEAHYGSPSSAFSLARVKAGIMGGFANAKGKPLPIYREWLQSDASILDRYRSE
jgi:hypothetical protein